MTNFEQDWKHYKTKHDDELDIKTIFVSAGLFVVFITSLLIGGAIF